MGFINGTQAQIGDASRRQQTTTVRCQRRGQGSIEGCKYALLYCAQTVGDGDGGNEGCVPIQKPIPVFVGFIPVSEAPLYNGRLNLLANLCPGL